MKRIIYRTMLALALTLTTSGLAITASPSPALAASAGCNIAANVSSCRSGSISAHPIEHAIFLTCWTGRAYTITNCYVYDTDTGVLVGRISVFPTDFTANSKRITGLYNRYYLVVSRFTSVDFDKSSGGGSISNS